ncbi:MAG TPA: GNAT family N-acetyltransferase [Thermoleophilaceae bacterium]|nr:GNAT family N-acetyltransferase [Thermoleophilaceae bacterium]
MSLVVEWIADRERFRALAEPWDRLADPLDSPFAQHRWYSAWWDAFGGSLDLSVLALWDGDELAGALPLYADGRELHWMSNWHTPAAAPLYSSQVALDRLVEEALRRGRPVLRPLPEHVPQAQALLAAIRSTRKLTLVDADQISPFVAIEGSWEDYRARMKRKWSSADRKARKMAREHDARFTIVERPEDLERQLAAGFEVEGSGWKGRTGTAISSSPETVAFYTDVARSFDAAGELMLSDIALDGKAIAFDLCLLRRGRLHLVKTGFDESYGPLSPGLVLRYLVVQRCFELGLETHELLGSEAEWKARFATGDRRHVQLSVLPRTPAGALRFGYRSFARPLLQSAYRSARRGARRSS